MSVISGTFTAASQASEALGAEEITIQLDFAGTATVDIESQLPDGTWFTVESKTADYHGVFEQGGAVPVRVKCTAHTDDVKYALTPR
jgi:hypothetical protein